MERRHGFFLATALGLAAIAGSYAAMQTTDLGAQAASVSQKEIAAADVRLDKQEAALRRAAKKRPPRLPKLPAKASASTSVAPGAAAPAASAGPAAPAPAPSGSLGSGPSDDSGHGSYDDDFDDDDFDDDAADDHEDHLDDLADAREDAADDSGHDDD
jgi:hypothetical protein